MTFSILAHVITRITSLLLRRIKKFHFVSQVNCLLHSNEYNKVFIALINKGLFFEFKVIVKGYFLNNNEKIKLQ